MSTDSISIPARFNGPLDSGQGGYSAGVAAAQLTGAVEVTLRRPVPLDTPLEVRDEGDGAVRVTYDESLIAEARSVPEFELEMPPAVTIEQARQASADYRGVADGAFSRCFVCGLAREDAFGVFAGEVDGRDVVASPWSPPAWAAAGDGTVLPEFVWAVLDCPTYFAVYLRQELPMSVLAQLTARVDGRVVAGEEHVVMSWPLSVDGRKRYAGAAVLSSEGEPLALAKALMIEPRQTR